jgi:hypothetical protein
MSRSIRQYSAGRSSLLAVFAILAVAATLPLTAQEASKPAPRLPDGKVDFGGKGVWAPIRVRDWADAQYVDKAVDVPFTPVALKLFQERKATLSKDDPEGHCLPPGVPRYTGTPNPFQILQLPGKVIILYEGAAHMYRTIYTDGRKHTGAKSLQPTWMGESIGSWEVNDTFVVDTIGFNGKTWLDDVGHPASESLHVVEKFRRPDSLTLAYEATIEDPVMYTRPWTTSFHIKFKPGMDLKEYICLK